MRRKKSSYHRSDHYYFTHARRMCTHQMPVVKQWVALSNIRLGILANFDAVSLQMKFIRL
ncbi:hypothetical protein QUF64_11955 [Anaerolineales bacterium HSG6]|nr:hypothetical protein [Anaerolineales bacterium HSG6]MDM8532966.1 hypothetical protein [Anaerolineales bacterium HSG25]